jgi:hypothetical protein
VKNELKVKYCNGNNYDGRQWSLKLAQSNGLIFLKTLLVSTDAPIKKIKSCICKNYLTL